MLSGTFNGNFSHVGVHHDSDELLKLGFRRIPAEFAARLGRVSEEVDHVGGTVEVWRNLDDDPACCLVDALLFGTFALPAQIYAYMPESYCGEFPYGMLLAGGYHIVGGHFLLEDEPHAFHIVRGVAPVAQRREIAQI